MKVADYPESSLTMRRELRTHFRYPVDGEAMLFPEGSGKLLRCNMLDLGLEGCRLRRESDFALQSGMAVEVSFRLAGQLFRFAGSIQWVAKNQILGVQFARMSDHRKQELSDLLGGMREEMDAREVDKQSAPPPEPEAAPAPAPQLASQENQPPAPQPTAEPARERREHDRHTVDSIARLLILSLHMRLDGTVLDVSLGGCKIRTHERIPVGVFRRVEVEFIVDGVSLLLPGVTQSIQDKHTIGIRFVEMTDRKRGQLLTVIEEIEQHTASEIPLLNQIAN